MTGLLRHPPGHAPVLTDSNGALEASGCPWPSAHPKSGHRFVRCIHFDDGATRRPIYCTSPRAAPAREVAETWTSEGTPVGLRRRTKAEHRLALLLHEREVATRVAAKVGERIVTAAFETASGARAEGYYRDGWHWTSWTA